MKKLFVSGLLILGIVFNSYSTCIRCNPDGNCWYSGSSCTKQSDGSGGNHCDPPVYTESCSCKELEIVPFGGPNGVGYKLPFISGPTSPAIDLWITPTNDLIIYNANTQVYQNLGNIRSDIDGKWYKFELSEDFQTLKLITLATVKTEFGEVASNEPVKTKLFEL